MRKTYYYYEDMGVICGIDKQICIYKVRHDAEYQIYILTAVVSPPITQKPMFDDILVFPKSNR